MDIIEQIGAYGGLAAVLGLAVLSALYFSQARDVKRLREWAGRAPERVAEGAAADQLARGVVAQPQPKVVEEAARTGAPAVPGAKPATPAAKPVPAAAAAAGAGPATADQKLGAAKPGVPVATPATASAAPATPAGKQGDTEEAEKTPVGATAATAAGAAAAETAAPGTGGPAPPKSPVPSPQTTDRRPQTPASAPAGPGVPPAKPRPTIPLPSQSGRPPVSDTAIIAPRSEPSWFQRLLASPRYLVLVIAGILIVGGAAAFGIVQLTSEDGGAPPAVEEPVGNGGGGADAGSDKPRPAPVNPAEVTVSVLNGTTIPGLAASIGDRVEANGFVLGNVDNSADQGARNESVVLFTDGAEREAIAVGRKLGISQREPIDATSQAIAGDASVVVITGTDLTQ